MKTLQVETAWNDYWQNLPPGQLYFPEEGREAVRRLLAAMPLSAESVVLDYGCGYGYAAAALAPHVGQMWVWDHAPAMLEFTQQALAALPNLRVWQLDDLETTFDLIWLNSVVQYMTEESLHETIGQLVTHLKPGGRIVLSDLIPPAHSFNKDLRSLLWFSLRKGYLVQAIRKTKQVSKTYEQYKKQQPLYCPDEASLQSIAASNQLDYQRHHENLTHFRHRTTVILTRPQT